MEGRTELSPTSRRSFNFSSLRIKRRHHSEEDGFAHRRGLRSFSSVPSRSRRDNVFEDASPPQSPHSPTQTRPPLAGTSQSPHGPDLAPSSGYTLEHSVHICPNFVKVRHICRKHKDRPNSADCTMWLT